MISLDSRLIWMSLLFIDMLLILRSRIVLYWSGFIAEMINERKTHTHTYVSICSPLQATTLYGRPGQINPS